MSTRDAKGRNQREEYGITTAVPLSPPSSPLDEKKEQHLGIAPVLSHSRSRGNHGNPTLDDAHHSVGLAVIEQKTTIPQTGERKVTTFWEYWLYIIYCGF